MLDRVAQAIIDAGDPIHFDLDEWGLICARAAIKSMREPTEAMLNTSGYQDADEVWRDMIDAALKQTS